MESNVAGGTLKRTVYLSDEGLTHTPDPQPCRPVRVIALGGHVEASDKSISNVFWCVRGGMNMDTY